MRGGLRFRGVLAVAGVLGLALSLGCDVDLKRMIQQRKYRPFAASSVFADGMVMRTPPLGTVPTSAPVGPPELLLGTVAQSGDPVTDIPVPVTAPLLDRGADRFQIFCQACHGPLGDGQTRVGDAMLLRRPASLQGARVRALPVGAIYRVIAEGYGLMPSYAAQLGVADRWAVVAYVKALQLSQEVALTALPATLQSEAKPWLE
jgi:mono/diheme cytochrome c family protein